MKKNELVSIINNVVNLLGGELAGDKNIPQLEIQLAEVVEALCKEHTMLMLNNQRFTNQNKELEKFNLLWEEENIELKRKLAEAQESLLNTTQRLTEMAEMLAKYKEGECGDDTTDIGTGMPKPQPHVNISGAKLALTKAIRVVPQDSLWERLAVNQDGKRFSVWFHQDFYLIEGGVGATGKPTKRPRPECVQFLARLKERGEQLGLRAFFTPDHLVIIAS
jgi:hypothetical protein